MTRAFLTLFFAGAAAGACSVAFRFLRRELCGAYPEPIFGFMKRAGRKKKIRKRGRILSFLLDFLLTFCFGFYLVLYDATVLGGTGRLLHLAVFFSGTVAVRRIALTVLFRPTERFFRYLFGLFGAAWFLLTAPVCKCLRFLFSILFGLYLIIKRKNDTMKRKKQAKRELIRLRSEMNAAFLPPEVTGAFAPGKE